MSKSTKGLCSGAFICSPDCTNTLACPPSLNKKRKRFTNSCPNRANFMVRLNSSIDCIWLKSLLNSKSESKSWTFLSSRRFIFFNSSNILELESVAEVMRHKFSMKSCSCVVIASDLKVGSIQRNPI